MRQAVNLLPLSASGPQLPLNVTICGVGFRTRPELRWENGSREAPQRTGRGGGFCAEEEDLLRGSGGQRRAGPGWEEGYLSQGPPRTPKEGWRGCKNPKGKSPLGCRPMSGGKEE